MAKKSNGLIEISYYQVAYVQVSVEDYRHISNELEGWAEGENNLCTNRAAIQDMIEDEETDNRRVMEIFEAVLKRIDSDGEQMPDVNMEEVGDIVFYK